MTARRVAEPDGPRSVLPAVALGGSAGAACGAGVMNAVTALAGAPNFRGTFGAAFGAVDVLVQALPLFVVNVLGSFLLGLLWAASRRRGPDWRPRLVAGLGTCLLYTSPRPTRPY